MSQPDSLGWHLQYLNGLVDARERHRSVPAAIRPLLWKLFRVAHNTHTHIILTTYLASKKYLCTVPLDVRRCRRNRRATAGRLSTSPLFVNMMDKIPS
jgi:hypothetical protein